MADSFDLAVLAPFVGLPSETFVRRHAEDLAPGRTVSVVTDMPRPGPVRWGEDLPTWSVQGRPMPGRSRLRLARVAGRVRGVPVGRWRWAPSADAAERLERDLGTAGVESMLVEFLDVWLSAADLLRRSVARLVVHGHGYDVSSRLTDPWWREQYGAWASADAIVVVAEHSRRRLAAIGLPEERIHVIPCGVDVPDEAPATRSADEDVVRLLAVGRFVAKKGPLHALRAFELAWRRQPALRLTMVGDGPLAADARRFVDERGLGDVVDLVGTRTSTEVQELLATADVFVQHSLAVPESGEEEGLPVAILEAMAAGVPVVSTRHAGIPEAVLDGETGRLVDEGDVDGMGAALAELGAEPSVRATLGRHGWERARESFSATRETRELQDLLGLSR